MMSNFICRISDLRWPQPACAGLDLVIAVALVVLAILLMRTKWRRLQCGTMQQLRGVTGMVENEWVQVPPQPWKEGMSRQ